MKAREIMYLIAIIGCIVLQALMISTSKSLDRLRDTFHQMNREHSEGVEERKKLFRATLPTIDSNGQIHPPDSALLESLYPYSPGDTITLVDGVPLSYDSIQSKPANHATTRQ